MTWLVIDGRRIWSTEIGRKYCKQCGEIIPRPKGFRQLPGNKRAAYSNTKYCSNYCKWKIHWNSLKGIWYRRERRKADGYKERVAEYQRRYRNKWRDKVNERRRLKRREMAAAHPTG